MKSSEIKAVKDKKLKSKLRKTEKTIRNCVADEIRAEILYATEDAGYLEAEGMEKTFKFSQENIQGHLDLNSQRKVFDLSLEDGPYRCKYSRNGKFVLLAGKTGHIASFDWKAGKLGCETNVEEQVRDVTWLHNEMFYAAAQTNYVYVYDHTGSEVHCLRKHTDATRLEFLPYHFLLASVGNAGYLRYTDTSTGKLVSEIRTKLGPCKTMTQNPSNAIIHLGHSNGTVTFWSPNTSIPVVKMLCHKGQVKSLKIDHSGNYMVSSGLDGTMKIWDVRTFKELFCYSHIQPLSSIDISQRGLLAVSHGPYANVFKDWQTGYQKNPYLSEMRSGCVVDNLSFCPYDDVLGVGHEKGFSSFIVPGSGEPNYDGFESNPFETKKARREGEVKKILDKIQPEMISLEGSFVGTIKLDREEIGHKKAKQTFEANNDEEYQRPIKKREHNMTGIRKKLKKRQNIIDARKEKLREEMKLARKELRQKDNVEISQPKPKKYSPFDRFVMKKA
ncbi:BING4CT-domain-containing protein [Rozella allomycis CSF55]|uniref:U three protein 7 n=1 Tax=Rozella allomycis (strain CSF55) TaxID=988480 RepID=A0A075AR58_ROZAC|nr:BING4 domain-containing protein [Rozella allomycis CSF55]RKP21428.1 BING4CT-domain-containing protein [Rozella allomycis CSF55]|eukprot:EPZ32635.1 BING4 domain-containing protein [Rozella allomycis CSF55]